MLTFIRGRQMGEGEAPASISNVVEQGRLPPLPPLGRDGHIRLSVHHSLVTSKKSHRTTAFRVDDGATAVFYSWLSDLPKGTNQTFIETCLNKAIKELRGTAAKLDPCLDRDTANVPGSPDISATILDKIDNCHVFVCDASIVQSAPRPTPNPNVLFELGYAVKRLGWERIICVANEHFGKVESLPFDVRQRRVKTYSLSPATTDRSDTAVSLTSALRRELELILSAAQDEGERLQLQFGEIETKTPLGATLQHSAAFYSCDLASIPDYSGEDAGGGVHGLGGMVAWAGGPNRDYLRQLAQFVQQSAATRRVVFVVHNGNRIPMNDLTMVIVFGKANGLIVLDEEPTAPAEGRTDNMMRGIRPVFSHFARPGKLTLNELPDRYEIRVDFGKVQAEANAWSEPVYMGASETCNLTATAELFADELTSPKRVTLIASFHVTHKPITDLPAEEWERLMGR